MSEWTLTETRLFEGVWQGVLTQDSGAGAVPDIQVTHLQEPVPNIELSESDQAGAWVLRVPIPIELVSDGVQTFVISDAGSQEALGSFALMSGDALGYDIRAEMSLLREELDMLKRAFRQHCLETQ